MSLVYHHITVVEKLCKRGHYSPLRWTGLAAEGELDLLSGSSGFLSHQGRRKTARLHHPNAQESSSPGFSHV